MAEQEITRIKLSFEHNIKKDDVSSIKELTSTLENLNDIKIDDSTAKNLTGLSKALTTFKGININKNLGAGVSGLVEAANSITKVKDITGYAENLSKSFKVLHKITQDFKGKSPNINKGLGAGITGIVEATNKIDEVKDISLQADNIRTGFHVLGVASRQFNETQGSIPKGLGDGITGIVDAINYIENVKDISLQADNLRTGFHVLGYVTRSFNETKGTIPVTLGRGITGIVDAINEIDEVKDISDKAKLLENNFKDMYEAVSYFEGMNTADYTGISRLVTAMTNVGKVKKLDDNVIQNATLLAKAINELDKEVTADIPKLEAINEVAKNLGTSFNETSQETKGFGSSLKLLNFELVIRNAKRLANTLQGLVKHGYNMVDAFGEVENTLSFFGQSLGTEAEKTASIIQKYADTGAIDFTQFADQVAKLNQIYKGYGIGAEPAAEMARNLTQLAYDASFALGENGKDIELWFQRATSLSTGQARSGYFFGVDTSVQALQESFDELDSSSSKAEKTMAVYNATIENTREIQGQMAREFPNAYVQMDVLRNRVTLLKRSIGQSLIPAFQWVIKWGQVVVEVIQRVINAISLFFGLGGFQLVDYDNMIQNVDSGMGSIADSANDLAGGMAGANKQAKELKKTITGIDQVFTIDDRKPTTPASGGGGVGGAGGVGGLDLAEGYDWLAAFENIDILDEVNAKADAIVKKMKDMFPWVVSIGSAFLGWKITKKFMDSLKWISETKDIFGGLGLGKLPMLTGLLALGTDLVRLKDYIKDFMESGPTFDNVTGMLSTFVGSIGDIMIMVGQTKIGGYLKLVQGIAEITTALADMVMNGPSWDNVEKFLYGLSNVALAIGVLKRNWKMVGTSLFMQGALGIIGQIKDVYDAVKAGEGSWSDLLGAELLISALTMLGGIVVAVGKFKKVSEKEKATKNVAETIKTTKSMEDLTKIEKSTNKLKMPSWTSIAKVLTAVAGGLALIVGAIWLIGKIDTSTLRKSKTNTELIGSSFLKITPALVVTLGAAAGLGLLINKTPVSWVDIAAGLLAIDVGIVNIIAMVALSSKWKTSTLEKGKTNITLAGEAFKSIELPLDLLLIKAMAIGTIIVASVGLGALALAAGILAINAALIDMLKLTEYAAKWDTSSLEKGKTNITLAGEAFTAISDPLSNLLDMVQKIGKNLSVRSWLTGKSYDFDKALGQLKVMMDEMIGWIGEYAKWDTNKLVKGGKTIDLAGKAGATVNEVLAPLLDMLDGIGKKTNNIFGIGDYDYDKALGILKEVMNSLLKWIGEYATWDTSRLDRGGKTIDLAGKAGKTVNEVLAPLMEMLNAIGKKTNNIFGIGDYDYDKSLSILQGIMDSLIKWIGEYATWDIEKLKAGAEVVKISSTPMSSINNAFEDLLPLLDSIGKKTNNLFGIGDYDYDKSMKVITNSMKAIVNAVSDLGKGTNVSNVDKGIKVINKTKDIVKDLGGFTPAKTSDLLKSADNFKEFSKELKAGFKDLQGIKTNNVSKIMDALNSLDLNKFKGIGKQIVQSMELGINNYTFNLSQAVNKIKKGLTFSSTSIGTKTASDMVGGINSSSANLNTFTNKIKKALTFKTKSYGSTIGKDVVSGINSSSVSIGTYTNKIKRALTFSTKSYGTTIAKDVVSGINGRSVNVKTFTNRIKSAVGFSSYYLGTNIAAGVQNGINGYWPDTTTFTNRLKRGMQVSFTIKSPSRWARDFVGAYIGEGVELGVNEYNPNFSPFKKSVADGLGEFDIAPEIDMTGFDTSKISGDISRLSANMNSKVKGEFEYTNDGTERAIERLTRITSDKLDRVAQGVEDGQVITMDGEKIGETSDRYIKEKAIRNNVVFE